jgi:hypothetical protein
MRLPGYEKGHGQIIIRDSPLMDNDHFALRIPEKISHRHVKTGSPDGYVESNISSP